MTPATIPLNFPLQAPGPILLTQLSSSNSLHLVLPTQPSSMAYIKKEQSVAQTYPQCDFQIAVQGAHNTTTQATHTRNPPTLSPGARILAVLHQIQCWQRSGGPGGPTGKLPRRLDWTGRQFLLRPVLGHPRTAGFEQGPRAPQGETLLCRPNNRTTGDGSGLQIP